MKLAITVLLMAFTQIVTSSTVYEACGGKPADIVFLLDSSASIIDPDYQKMLNFTREIVSNFDIGPGKTRVGLATFSDEVYPKFNLEDNNNKEDILEQIKTVGKDNGGTNTADALNFARTGIFSRNEEQTDVPHIVIILTDGQSQNKERTEHEASLAHQEGIVIFVIGIGNQVDDSELSAIASNPIEQYKFTVGSFDALNSIKRELAIKACEVPPATRPPAAEEEMISESDILFGGATCGPRVPVTVTFAVDSADIGITNSKYVLRFIKNVVDRLNMESQQMTVSAVTNGCGDNPNVLIDSAHDNSAINAEIGSIGGPKGMKPLMQKMRQKLAESPRSMSRVGILFIGDRIEQSDLRQAIQERRRAKFQKVEIFVIGVGDRVEQDQAESLTTERDHYFFTQRYETLSQLEGPMLLEICTTRPNR